MCLYTHNTKPLVSDKDITVFKLLQKRKGDGFITTPYRFKEAKLGSMLKAEGEIPSLPEDYSMNKVGEGVIHAALRMCDLRPFMQRNDRERFAVKAVIKAGTPFFVDFSLNSIAASEMYLTEETVLEGDAIIGKVLSETRGQLYEIMMGQDFMTGENGVRVGDVLLSGKTFARVEDVKYGKKVIGVVGFIRPDGKPQVVACNYTDCLWEEKPWLPHMALTEGISADISTAAKDFDGYGHCRKAFEKMANFERYGNSAVGYCLRYRTAGTKEGDWYLPSVGEMLQTARNKMFINKTLDKLQHKNQFTEIIMLTDCRHYFTSSETSEPRVYSCSLVTATMKLNRILPYSYCNVLPFLRLP